LEDEDEDRDDASFAIAVIKSLGGRTLRLIGLVTFEGVMNAAMALINENKMLIIVRQRVVDEVIFLLVYVFLLRGLLMQILV
jgi:hypothetical protein